MRTILPLVALSLVACSKDEVTDDTADLGCEVEIRQTFPAIDAADFYYKGIIEFQLNKADDTAVLSIDGVDGTSSLNARNDIVYFTPTADLSPSTTYTATLSYCTGDANVSFTTSALGTDLDSSVDLTATTYSLDLQSGRVVIPEGVGAVLQEYLDFQILVQPTSVENGEITLMGAVPDNSSEPVNQDYCSPSIPFPAADFSNAPSFIFGPQSTTIDAAGYSITIDDLMISGTFSADGTWFGGATLAGEIDTRPLVPILFEGETDPNAICEFIEGFSVFCTPCQGDETIPYCLEIEAQDLIAEATGGPTVEYIELEDCHDSCATTFDDNGDHTNAECTL